MGISVVAYGSRACFTNPLLKMEQFTYDCITPSAAVGILRSLYWHPQMRWVIDGITVLNPIKHQCEMHNGLAGQQRRTTFLTNVAYRIDAHFERCENEGGDIGAFDAQKIWAIINRRLDKGQRFNEPFLGLREYEAFLRKPVDTDVSCFLGTGEIDLGVMLYSVFDENGKQCPHFYHAIMKDGFIDVAAAREQGLLRKESM